MRHHTSLVAPRFPLVVQLKPAAVSYSLPDTALLDLADPALETRVILIGPGTLNLLCALIRLGCSQAAAVQLTDRPQAGMADVALVPQAGSPECIDAAVALARRALAPLGSVILRLAVGSPDALARHARRTLQLHGFSSIRLRASAGRTLLSADLPVHGRLARA